MGKKINPSPIKLREIFVDRLTKKEKDELTSLLKVSIGTMYNWVKRTTPLPSDKLIIIKDFVNSKLDKKYTMEDLMTEQPA